MKKEYYKFKNNIKWRKEGGSLLFFHAPEKRLLIFNAKASQGVSADGVIELKEANRGLVRFLKGIKAINKTADQMKRRTDNKKSKRISAPLNVTIQFTNKCNLNCLHCHNNKQNLPKTLAIAKYKELVDELARLKVFNINISGGEPLLIKEIVEVVKYAVDRGMSCTMSTNLTLLNEKLAAKLARAGLRKVHISLDSFSPLRHDKMRGVVGSFERMKKNLRFLRNNNIQYTMVTTLVDQTPRDYGKTVDLAYQLGAAAHKTNTVVPQGKSKSLKAAVNKGWERTMKEYVNIWKNKKNKYSGKMEILAETMFAMQIGEGAMFSNKAPEILRVGCPAGVLTCAINESGDVTPCSFFTGLVVGNIFQDKFVDIWNGDRLNALRNRKKISICGKCRYRENCGGCRARSFGQFGRINQRDPRCFLKMNSIKK